MMPKLLLTHPPTGPLTEPSHEPPCEHKCGALAAVKGTWSGASGDRTGPGDVSNSAIILAHNHPGGDPTPSVADIDMREYRGGGGSVERISPSCATMRWPKLGSS